MGYHYIQMLNLTVNWTMTLAFNAALAVAACILKPINIYVLRKKVKERSLFYLLSPTTSAEALARARPASAREVKTSLKHALTFGFLSFAFYLGYAKIFSYWHPSLVVMGYFGIPILYLTSEAYGAFVALVFFPTGRLPVPVHDHPFKAANLSDFWGSRWNRWTSDLFLSTIIWPLRRRPTVALAVTFLVSGLIHEFTINGTLFWIVGRNLFGTQLLYFAIQGIGMHLDRSWLRRFPRFRRLFLWITVVVPSPLILNEGYLRIWHLWPYVG